MLETKSTVKISSLEKRLHRVLRDVRSGKTIGPFSTLTEGLNVLKTTSKFQSKKHAK